MRIYRPDGTGPFPAVVAVHGGTWTDLDGTSDEPISQALAASGVVVAAVDFRVAPADPYPAAIADVNFATHWLKAHAADYSVDPRAIGGFGSSSGGHIAMLSAMRPRDERYTALPLASGAALDVSLAYVVLHSPVIDPVARYEYARATGRTDIWPKHDGFYLTMDAMRESNPRLILDADDVEFPPTLVIHGTADLNVPVMEVEDFAQAYGSVYDRAEDGRDQGTSEAYEFVQAKPGSTARARAAPGHFSIDRRGAACPTPAGCELNAGDRCRFHR